jgi:hypothetical protein
MVEAVAHRPRVAHRRAAHARTIAVPTVVEVAHSAVVAHVVAPTVEEVHVAVEAVAVAADNCHGNTYPW